MMMISVMVMMNKIPLHQLDTEMVFWIPFDYAVSHQVGRRLTPQSMSSHHHHHNPHHPHHHSGVCHVPQHNWSGPCSRATCRGEKQRVQKAGRGKTMMQDSIDGDWGRQSLLAMRIREGACQVPRLKWTEPPPEPIICIHMT